MLRIGAHWKALLFEAEYCMVIAAHKEGKVKARNNSNDISKTIFI